MQWSLKNYFAYYVNNGLIGNENLLQIDLSRIPTNNDAESRWGWTKMQQMNENVHPKLALVLLFVRTEVDARKFYSLICTRNSHIW